MANVSTGLTADQQEFLEAATALGATSAGGARPLTEWPRLSTRELDELVDRGLVREASAVWTYYVYTPKGTRAELAPTPEAVQFSSGRFDPAQFSRGRLAKTLWFWILVILIPIAFLQYTGGR